MTQIQRRVWGLAVAALVLTGASVGASAPPMQRTGEDVLRDRIEYGLETSPIVKKYDIKLN